MYELSVIQHNNGYSEDIPNTCFFDKCSIFMYLPRNIKNANSCFEDTNKIRRKTEVGRAPRCFRKAIARDSHNLYEWNQWQKTESWN